MIYVFRNCQKNYVLTNFCQTFQSHISEHWKSEELKKKKIRFHAPTIISVAGISVNTTQQAVSVTDIVHN